MRAKYRPRQRLLRSSGADAVVVEVVLAWGAVARGGASGGARTGSQHAGDRLIGARVQDGDVHCEAGSAHEGRPAASVGTP